MRGDSEWNRRKSPDVGDYIEIEGHPLFNEGMTITHGGFVLSSQATVFSLTPPVPETVMVRRWRKRLL